MRRSRVLSDGLYILSHGQLLPSLLSQNFVIQQIWGKQILAEALFVLDVCDLIWVEIIFVNIDVERLLFFRLLMILGSATFLIFFFLIHTIL